MPAIPESTFTARLQECDHEQLLAFVADLWEASGWTTAVDGSVVIAETNEDERRLLVVPPARLQRLRAAPAFDGTIDRVVTGGTDETAVPRGLPDAPVLTASDLRDRLVYGVDAAAGDSLCQTYLGVPLRDHQWETTDTETSNRPLKPLVATLTVLVLFAVVGVFLTSAFESPAQEPSPSAVDAPSEPTVETSTPASPSSADPVAASTRADGPTVYVGALDDTLYAVGADSGRRVWEFTRPSAGIGSSPTVVRGVLYVGAGDGAVEAIDAETGEQRWRYTQLDGPIFASPTVVTVSGLEPDDGSVRVSTAGQYHRGNSTRQARRLNETELAVFVPSFDGTLHALDAETGAREWTFTGNGSQFLGSPTYRNGTVFVGDDAGLYALDAATGVREWTFAPTDSGIVSSPAVTRVEGPNSSKSVVYVTIDGRLYAVDGQSGTVRWSRANATTTLTAIPPAVTETTTGDTTVFTVSGGDVVALNGSTGDLRWRYEGAYTWTSAPTPGDGALYVGTANGTLVSLDATTGERRWQFTEPESSIHTLPTTAGDGIYFGTDNGTLYAVDADTGTQRWRQTLSDRWIRSSPTVVVDPVNGYSIDSRVTTAILGHHDLLRPPRPADLSRPSRFQRQTRTAPNRASLVNSQPVRSPPAPGLVRRTRLSDHRI